jgi:hypothetical protein
MKRLFVFFMLCTAVPVCCPAAQRFDTIPRSQMIPTTQDVAAVSSAVSAVGVRASALEAGSNRWNTAYGWGNHAGMYLGLSEWAIQSNLIWAAIAGAKDTNALQISVFTAYTNALNQSVTDLQEDKLDTAVFDQVSIQVTAVVTQMLGQITALQTNPPAAGIEGSVQINQAGKLYGNSNLIWSAVDNAYKFRSTNGVMFRMFKNDLVAESNLIYRLANEGGKAVVRFKNNGIDGLVLSSAGVTLGGVTRTNWAEADPVALPVITRLTAGTDAFGGILLDRKITSWGEVGVTYSNAVRINNPITVTNNSTWTGWTTTGSLVASNEILLLTGQYLLSPVQSNGVARYAVSSYSSQNGTPETRELLAGTNVLEYPYYGTNAQLKITAGDPFPEGLYVSAVTLVGYENLSEAAAAKYVAGLRRTDAEANPDDITSKRYVDAAKTASENHADSGLATYADDPSKTVKADKLEMGNYTLVGSGAWKGVNFTQTADSATIGTRFNDNILSLESGRSVVQIQSLTITGTNATLNMYAQNIVSNPVVSVTTNLIDGTWVAAAATVTNLGSGIYRATVDISGLGAAGFFRASAATSPAVAGQVKITVPVLNLNSNRMTEVSEIIFTNGWKIACTTNGLEFISP